MWGERQGEELRESIVVPMPSPFTPNTGPVVPGESLKVPGCQQVEAFPKGSVPTGDPLSRTISQCAGNTKNLTFPLPPPHPGSPRAGQLLTPLPTPGMRYSPWRTRSHCSVACFYLCPQIFQKNYKILKWREHRSHNSGCLLLTLCYLMANYSYIHLASRYI